LPHGGVGRRYLRLDPSRERTSMKLGVVGCMMATTV
jgi:hypothetical protein